MNIADLQMNPSSQINSKLKNGPNSLFDGIEKNPKKKMKSEITQVNHILPNDLKLFKNMIWKS
jgi:hypothetical protein